jgi:hypothetical protein
MTELQKVEKILGNVSNQISNIDQSLSKRKRVITVREQLYHFAVILKYCLDKNSIKSSDCNSIVDKIEFEMNRLFEICDLNIKDLKKYN